MRGLHEERSVSPLKNTRKSSLSCPQPRARAVAFRARAAAIATLWRFVERTSQRRGRAPRRGAMGESEGPFRDGTVTAPTLCL